MTTAAPTKPVKRRQPKYPRCCLLCGEMICGCALHSSSRDYSSRYGVCETCMKSVADRAGEHYRRTNDEVYAVNSRAPAYMYERIRLALEQFQREEATS